MNILPCPLCASQNSSWYHNDRDRDFYLCATCHLVFADPASYLSLDEERKRYDFHQNDLEDAGYRTFLNKMVSPMLSKIAPEAQGLDFGSGPGPLLKKMFEEAGHPMEVFDSYYAADPSIFKRNFDFITATEVVEHLHQPLKELNRLWNCLKPGGYLGLMTSLNTTDIVFSNWHYHRDETHVVFFAPETMAWLAKRWQADIHHLDTSVVIFHKTNSLSI